METNAVYLLKYCCCRRSISSKWVILFITKVHFNIVIFDSSSVVSQYYDTDVNKEYVIRGNSAILKCQIPSYVADFLSVVSWHSDDGEEIYPSDNYGKL